MNVKPSEAQIAAGNYEKRHEKFQGLNISIETPKGAERRGIGKDGNPWSVKMPHDYGYIKRTEGADGDQVDVYIGHHKKSPNVFIVDQHDTDSGEFDEHKVMLGFANAQQATRAYDRGFSDGSGPDRRRALLHMGMEDFKKWLAAGNAKKSVKGFAKGGRVNKASGGWVMLQNDQRPSEENKTDVPAPKKEEPSWFSSTLSDMGNEASKGFTEAWGNVKDKLGSAALKRSVDRGVDPNASLLEKHLVGPAKDTLGLASGILSVPGMVIDPVMGAAKSLYANTVTPAADAVFSRLPGGEKFDREGFKEDQKRGFETAANALAAPRASALRVMPRPANTPSVAPIPETIGDFNVPLTIGEASRDATQISNERKALQGAMGQRARAEAEARIGNAPNSEREIRLQEARDNIGAGFDRQGNQLIVDSPEIGGNLLQQAVQDARRIQKTQVDQAYRDFRSVEGEFSPEIFSQPLGQRVSAYAFPEGGEFRFNSRRMPIADEALQYLDDITASVASGRPVTAQAMDDARRELVSFEKLAKQKATGPSPDASDWNAMQKIRRGFDEFVQDAFNGGHFTGDANQAAGLWHAARETNRAYREAFFQRNPGDVVGREMERIFGKTPDQALEPHTIIRNILGAPGTLGQKDLAPKMIRRLRDVLGEGSAEFSGLRQSAFQILTEFGEGRSPGKVAKDIRVFLDGYGRRTSETLFDPSQRQVIRRYGELLERMVPPPGTVQGNPHHVFWRGVKTIIPVIGAAIFGGLTGGVGMGLAAAAGTGTYQAIKPFMDARRVARWMPTFTESFDRWARAQTRLSQNPSAANQRIGAAANANFINTLSKIGIDGAAILKQINSSSPVGAEEEDKKKRRRD